MNTAIGMLEVEHLRDHRARARGHGRRDREHEQVVVDLGDEVAEPVAAELADDLRVQPVELAPARRRCADRRRRPRVKRESWRQFAMSGPVARCTSSVGVRSSITW